MTSAPAPPPVRPRGRHRAAQPARGGRAGLVRAGLRAGNPGAAAAALDPRPRADRRRRGGRAGRGQAAEHAEPARAAGPGVPAARRRRGRCAGRQLDRPAHGRGGERARGSPARRRNVRGGVLPETAAGAYADAGPALGGRRGRGRRRTRRDGDQGMARAATLVAASARAPSPARPGPSPARPGPSPARPGPSPGSRASPACRRPRRPARRGRSRRPRRRRRTQLGGRREPPPIR